MWSYVHGDPARVNAKTAFDAMRAGDALGTQVVQNFVEYVACGLTNLINIFQPEIICIGGAQVSQRHCGFIVNTGNATCADVLCLADTVCKIVTDETGFQLEKEVRVVK